MHARMHAHTWTRTCMHTHAHAHTHACMHTHTDTHMHARICTHTCTHAHAHTPHTHVCTCAHTHTHHTHVHAHTYAHTYAHMHMRTRSAKGRKEGNVLINDTLNTFYLRLYSLHKIWSSSMVQRVIGSIPHG